MRVAHALFSMQDPTRAEKLARFLSEKTGAKILATAPTAALLRERGLTVKETSGLCSVGSGDDPVVRAPSGEVIDLIVVELPAPFGRTPPREGFDLIAFQMDLVEPFLVRCAVARFERTCIVVDHTDHDVVAQGLLYLEDLDLPFCRMMARKALSRLAAYDGPLTRELTSFDAQGFRQPLPEVLLAGYGRQRRLDSGSNRQQQAWLYRADDPPPGTLPTTLNYAPTGPLDLTRARDAALAMELLAEHAAPTAVLLARQRPIAVASAGKIETAVEWLSKRIPPGLSEAVLAMNAHASAEVFRLLERAPVAVVAAPSVEPDAVEEVAERRKGVSLLATGGMVRPEARDVSILVVPGGLLVEERDATCRNEVESGDAAARRPTERETDALVFAWAVAKYVRSDAVVLARPEGGVMATVGVGSGETSRREAIERALAEAGAAAEGAVLASDGAVTAVADLERIARAGVRALVHPGGREAGPGEPVLAVRGADTELAIVSTNVAHIRY